MSGVIQELGLVCRELRRERRINRSKIAAQRDEGGGSESSLARWEQGHSQPRNLDDLVELYAETLDVPVARLWRMAITRYEESAPVARSDGSGLTGRPGPQRNWPFLM